MLTRLLLPPRPAALHTGFERLLQVASTLPLPVPNPAAAPGAVHMIGVSAMALDIGDRRMDGVIRAHPVQPCWGKVHRHVEDIGERSSITPSETMVGQTL